jgi:hypothetical protein
LGKQLLGDHSLDREQQGATDAAFSIVSRVARTGSITPPARQAPNSPVGALRPPPSGIARAAEQEPTPSLSSSGEKNVDPLNFRAEE